MKQRTATWDHAMACRASDGRVEILATLNDGPDRGRVVRLQLSAVEASEMVGTLTRFVDRPETIEATSVSLDDEGERSAALRPAR